MKGVLQVKFLFLFFCLFVSTDALLSLKLNKNNGEGRPSAKYYFSLSAFTESPSGSDKYSGYALHAANLVTPISSIGVSGTHHPSFCYKGYSSNTEHPRKIKKHRRTKAVTSYCLLVEPIYFQSRSLVYLQAKEYLVFSEQWIPTTEFSLLSLRGPPSLA